MRGAGPSSPGSSAALWKVALLGGRWRIHQSSIFLAVSKPPATTVGLLIWPLHFEEDAKALDI